MESKLILLSLFLLASLFFIPSNATAWYNSSYNYRVQLNITNSTQALNGTLYPTGYNLEINLTIPKAHINANLTDLLTTWVSNSNSTEYETPYWVQNNVSDGSNVYVDMFVEAPSVEFSSSSFINTSMYAYYGDSSVTTFDDALKNNISATFPFGDTADFPCARTVPGSKFGTCEQYSIGANNMTATSVSGAIINGTASLNFSQVVNAAVNFTFVNSTKYLVHFFFNQTGLTQTGPTAIAGLIGIGAEPSISNMNYEIAQNASNGAIVMEKLGLYFNPQCTSSIFNPEMEMVINTSAYATAAINQSYRCGNSGAWFGLPMTNNNAQLGPTLKNIFFGTNDAAEKGGVIADSIYIRPYIDSEPTISVSGTEQSQGSPAVINNVTAIQNIEINHIINQAGTFIVNYASICVKDEDTFNSIYYDVTFSNSSYSSQYTNQTCGSSFPSSNLPNPAITTYLTNSTFSNITYAPRNYFISFPTTNTSYTFYLPNLQNSWAVRFHFFSVGLSTPISNVLANASLMINTSTIVEQEVAGGSGIASFYLEPTKSYSLSFGASGYQTFTETLTPSQQDYNIYLTPIQSNTTFSNSANYFWSVIQGSGIYDNNIYIPVNFTYIDYAGITNYWGLNVTYPNGTVILSYINNTSQFGTKYLQIYTANYYQIGSIDVVAFANRQDVGDIIHTYIYTIIGNTTTNSPFPNWLNLGNSISLSGLGHPTTDIIGIFAVALTIAFFSKLNWSFIGSSIIGLLMLGLFMAINIIQFNPTPVYNWGSYTVLWISVISILYLWKGI